jgi:hypothetical protein
MKGMGVKCSMRDNNGDFGGLRRFKLIPGSIRELLKRLINRKAVIVLDANIDPEFVEIENVVGNLLVAEFQGKFKFVDIDCICEVIISRDELLEALLGKHCCEDDDKDKDKDKFDCDDFSQVLGTENCFYGSKKSKRQ